MGIRATLGALGRGARKSLGQHFLHDAGMARRIVELARLTGRERVIEIGPGLGAITALLRGVSAQLHLVELDVDFAARLASTYADDKAVQVLHEDALHTDWHGLLGPGEPAVVVANLPYNVATPILARLLAARGCFSRIVVMVQREVAERLAAVPGTKAYAALSVLTQVEARVERALRVRPGAFVPPPKVDSEVIVLTPLARPPVPIADPERFALLVRTVFQQRRKQLRNSLRPLCASTEDALRGAGIDPDRRPETLTLAEFAALAAALPPRGEEPVA